MSICKGEDGESFLVFDRNDDGFRLVLKGSGRPIIYGAGREQEPSAKTTTPPVDQTAGTVGTVAAVGDTV